MTGAHQRFFNTEHEPLEVAASAAQFVQKMILSTKEAFGIRHTPNNPQEYWEGRAP